MHRSNSQSLLSVVQIPCQPLRVKKYVWMFFQVRCPRKILSIERQDKKTKIEAGHYYMYWVLMSSSFFCKGRLEWLAPLCALKEIANTRKICKENDHGQEKENTIHM